MMMLRIAWRNIFRNKRRTIVSGLAIGIGLAALIFSDAIMIGMLESMIRSATDAFLGHAQIHRKGFRDTLSVEMTINNLNGLISSLKKDPNVRAFSVRTVAFGMLSSAYNVSSVIFYGIDPEDESKISKIRDSIIKGSYLSDHDRDRVLIGDRLADDLEVGIGDRVVITTSQAETGDLAQEMFRVGGIFRTGVKDMDSGMVFINIQKAQDLLGIGNNAHEIAIVFDDVMRVLDPGLGFSERYSINGNEALGWRELLTELDAVVRLSGFTKYIIALVMFGLVALIILNTLFTSLYERLFEFGVLRAIGTRPSKMAMLILMEAGSLSIISIVIGTVVAIVVNYIFSIYGIDYRGVEFAQITFLQPIYPVMTLRQYIEYPVWIFMFSIIAGLYPAIYAARLIPSKVLRKTL